MSFKLGVVTHYYEKMKMAIVALDNPIGIGDDIKFVQNNEDLFTQKVHIIQKDTEKVESAGKGEVVGIKVEQEVAPGAEIFKTPQVAWKN